MNSFGVADGNRSMNPRLRTSGLVEELSPTSDPAHYLTLPKPYTPTYE